jgi:hypothetical protein
VRETGVLVGAGAIEFPGYQMPAELVDNRVSGFTLRDSTVRAPNAVVLQGGSVTQTEDAVRRSGVEQVVLEGNVVEGGAVPAVAVGGFVGGGGQRGSGAVEGCEIASLLERGNATPAGEPLGVVVVQQAVSGGAPDDSARDNRVVP